MRSDGSSAVIFKGLCLAIDVPSARDEPGAGERSVNLSELREMLSREVPCESRPVSACRLHCRAGRIFGSGSEGLHGRDGCATGERL